jgi:hypothetical protein
MPKSPVISRKRHIQELRAVAANYEAALSAVRRSYEAERQAMDVSTSLINAVREES